MMARHRSTAVRLLLFPNKQMHLDAPSWSCLRLQCGAAESERLGQDRLSECWRLGQFV
jgi:hypothetical protein